MGIPSKRSAAMQKIRFLLAAVVPLVIAGFVRGDDPPTAGGTSAPRLNLGSTLQDIGRLNSTATDSPFSRGLGQAVSGWTHDGVHGTELADRIHWLQQQRRDGSGLTSFSDRGDTWRRDGDGRWSRERDIREDRREIRDDMSRLRDDERRVARDREELRRDLSDARHDRNPQDRARDYRELREDRQRLRDDEQRVSRDRQELRNDREDLRRDLNRDRDGRYGDRDNGSRDRDIREDRREVRDDERRLHDDERRVARDRQDVRQDYRDLRNDRNPEDRSRDYRELRDDRQRLRDDEQRVSRDRQDLRNDRDDLRRDQNRDRDNHFGDRDRDDRFRDRNRDDHRHDFANHDDRGRHGGPGGQHERDAHGWQVRDQHGWSDRTDHRHDHDVVQRNVGHVAQGGGKGGKGTDFAKHIGSLGAAKNDHGIGFGRDFGNFGKNILPNNQRPLPANLPFGGGKGLKVGKGGKG
jgi:hypothetical protein